MIGISRDPGAFAMEPSRPNHVNWEGAYKLEVTKDHKVRNQDVSEAVKTRYRTTMTTCVGMEENTPDGRELE